MQNTIRILRLYEFIGPRSAVEAQVAASMHGTVTLPSGGIQIRATTLGEFPEVLAEAPSQFKLNLIAP